MTNPASKPSRNIFDLIVQMPRDRDFALAMCQHLAHLDHPVDRQFQTKLEQAIHRHTREASCGTGAAGEQHWSPEVARSPGPQRRGRFEDPRLAELHEDEEALRQEQRQERIRQAEERGRMLAESAAGTGLTSKSGLLGFLSRLIRQSGIVTLLRKNIFRRRRVMPKKRFQPEEIIGRLRHADVLLGQGKNLTEIVKALGG